MLGTKKLAVATVQPGRELRFQSEQGRELMLVGAKYGWDFQVLGRGPVPSAPVATKTWRFVPINQEKGTIPAHALGRVQAIYQAGIRPKTFVIAHEIPQQIEQAGPSLSTRVTTKVEELKPYAKELAHHSGTALRFSGHVLMDYVLPVAGVVLVGFALAMAIGLASGIDPCLIAVTEDNVWIQIDSWIE